jgi:ADP-heptose:LPS heptosyltransferase
VVKFLVVRFSSIGDIVLTTPVIRCVKKQVKDSTIHFVTKEQYTPLLSHNPYIDRIHPFTGDLKKLIRKLQGENFDYIIDLHHNLRSTILKARIKAIPFSFPKLNWEKWLMVNLKINRLPGIHIVDRYLQTVRLFDVQNDNHGLDYFIPEGEEVVPNSLPEEFRNGYVTFSIGGMHNTKKLTTNKILEICNRINFPIILLGGKEDTETAEIILEQAGKNIYNGCGKFSINQSASLIKQSVLTITHDTGLMHIAAAFKKKIISVWGNTIPEFGMYPYQPDPDSEMVQVDNLPCRPCSKIGYDKCPKKHFNCIKEIDTKHIEQLVNKWLMGE